MSPSYKLIDAVAAVLEASVRRVPRIERLAGLTEREADAREHGNPLRRRFDEPGVAG